MPALVAGIHVFLLDRAKDVDGRDKPGHDELFVSTRYFTTAAVWPNSSLRSSSVRIAGWPKFGLTSLALA
jgi:hypothetical protein